ncbi:hypothetical protein QIW31_07000 [Francisellaceae bacterium CB299]|jgi:hypothetical protein
MKKTNVVGLILTGGFFTVSSALACSAFIKNDVKENYVFAKSRDVTFHRYDPTFLSITQENITFNAPKDGFKYIALEYSQSQPTPNIFSTGTNEKNITMSYNYDSSQLADTGDNMSRFTPSIINMANKFNTYIISHIASLDDANNIIKKAVENFNNNEINDIPMAVPMFLSFAQHVPNGKDKFEIVEIVIANPETIKNTYFKSLNISGYQDFQENKKCLGVLNSIYGKGFDQDMVNVFNNVLTANNYICSYIGRTDFKNNISNTTSYYFANQAANLVAYNNLKLAYNIRTSNDYVVETNSIASPNLQKHSYFTPPESISRYKSLDNLLKNSEEIAKFANDKTGYSRELAIMFLNNIYNPSKYDDTGYDMSENMAVSRENSRAKYVTSFIKDNATGNEVPYVFAEFTSPAQPYNRATIKLNDNFWDSHNDGDVIVDQATSYYRFNQVYQN